MKTSPILVFLCLGFLLPAENSFAQSEQDSIVRRVYQTTRIQGSSPTIDGILDDQAWEQVAWATDFLENEPNNGGSPSQETAFKILYDEKFLYIGYRCFDTEPDSIEARMSRRDGFAGDWVEINIDSYHDLQSGFSFTSGVSGVKGDETITNQFNWDTNFNPIWYLKSTIDDEGWVAEVKIPFSQLRFTGEDEQVWGFQINRRHMREGTRSTFQEIPNNAPYWVRGFAELHGIKGIKPQKQVEIQPYVVGKIESFPEEEGNPFATGNDSKLTA
ncbi:MAG: carbohydrate binding family 9 domain-containing protein [Saprospiraceae bacterium]|nr:carbohydrate binding family 9 domain-containing protein [Saprospiraceae bacterium]